MANRERGEQRLAVGAQTYILRLTTGAICHLEDLAGTSFDSIAGGVQRGRLRDTRAFLWAALQDRHAHECATLEIVGGLIDRAGGVWMIRPALEDFLDLNANPDPPSTKKTDVRPPQDPWRRLYVQLRAGGISAEAFWQLSLREVWLELSALQEQHKQRVELAWMTEYMARQKVLNWRSYEALAGTGDHAAPRTHADRLEQLQQVSAQLGIPLQRIPYVRRSRAA